MISYESAMRDLGTFIEKHANLFTELPSVGFEGSITERVDTLRNSISHLQSQKRELEETKEDRKAITNEYDGTWTGPAKKIWDALRNSPFHKINDAIAIRDQELIHLQKRLVSVEKEQVQKLKNEVDSAMGELKNLGRPERIKTCLANQYYPQDIGRYDGHLTEKLKALQEEIQKSQKLCTELNLPVDELQTASQKVNSALESLSYAPKVPDIPDDQFFNKMGDLVDQLASLEENWLEKDEENPHYFQNARELVKALQTSGNVAEKLKHFTPFHTDILNGYERARHQFQDKLLEIAKEAKEAERVGPTSIPLDQKLLDSISDRIKHLSPEDKRKAWIMDRDLQWSKRDLEKLEKMEAKEKLYDELIKEQEQRKSSYNLEGFLKFGDDDQLAAQLKTLEASKPSFSPELKELVQETIRAKTEARDQFIGKLLEDVDKVKDHPDLPEAFKKEVGELFYDKEKLEQEMKEQRIKAGLEQAIKDYKPPTIEK